MNVGEVLANLPTNRARAEQCLRWAQNERDRYLRGQDDVIGDVLLSRSDQFRMLSREQRVETGRFRWQQSPLAVSIAADEAMYSRWAMMFYNASSDRTLMSIAEQMVPSEAMRVNR